MKDHILGTHKVRKREKANGNLGRKKNVSNFWDEAPIMTEKEKKEELEDLGYDPLNQMPVGNEKLENS